MHYKICITEIKAPFDFIKFILFKNDLFDGDILLSVHTRPSPGVIMEMWPQCFLRHVHVMCVWMGGWVDEILGVWLHPHFSLCSQGSGYPADPAEPYRQHKAHRQTDTHTHTGVSELPWQLHSWEQWRAHRRDPENTPQLPDRKAQIVNGDHTHFPILKGSCFFPHLSPLWMLHISNCWRRVCLWLIVWIKVFSTDNKL